MKLLRVALIAAIGLISCNAMAQMYTERTECDRYGFDSPEMRRKAVQLGHKKCTSNLFMIEVHSSLYCGRTVGENIKVGYSHKITVYCEQDT